MITIDNGPELAGKSLDAWAYRHGVLLDFIQPGKPVENAFIESFNGKFRDECLNRHLFLNLAGARRLIDRQNYNDVRPHSSLRNLTLAEFAILHSNSGSFSTSTPNPGLSQHAA